MIRDRSYYRKLLKASGGFVVDMASKKWCNRYHTHFDLDGKGKDGRVHRIRHLNAHLRALRRARLELQSSELPYQLFAYIDLNASENDAVYVHTPNPDGTDFPIDLNCMPEEVTPPPLLSCRIDRRLFRVLRSTNPDPQIFYVVPRSAF